MSVTYLRSKAERQGGFTLVEMVVSSAILMMVFVAILGTVSTARRISSLTENQLACLHIARTTLEPLNHRSYDSSDFAEGTRQLQNRRGYYAISEVSGQRSKDVTVVVNWVEPTGMTQSVSLTTSYSRSLHR